VIIFRIEAKSLRSHFASTATLPWVSECRFGVSGQVDWNVGWLAKIFILKRYNLTRAMCCNILFKRNTPKICFELLQFSKPAFVPIPQLDWILLHPQSFSTLKALASTNPTQGISAPQSSYSAKAFPPSIPKKVKVLLLGLSMADEVQKNHVTSWGSQLVKSVELLKRIWPLFRTCLGNVEHDPEELINYWVEFLAIAKVVGWQGRRVPGSPQQKDNFFCLISTQCIYQSQNAIHHSWMPQSYSNLPR